MPDPSGAAIKAACTHWLSQHVPVPVGERLRGLASSPHAALEPDVYGKGGAVAVLEARTAELLGKPAAVFVAKGMTAQLCSLRAHIEARGTTDVAIHPQSHLDVDEAGAIERVGGAAAIRLGRYRPFGVAELQAVTDRLAAVVIELPLRRSGYLLPPLGELKAISAHCRDHRIPLHFDGARLWEAAAAYGVPLADLAALAAIQVNAGDISFAAALFVFGLYSALMPKRPKINPLSLISFTTGAGAVMLIPLVGWEISGGDVLKSDTLTISTVVFVVIFPSTMAYLFFNRGIELIGPNRAAPFFHLVPVFGSAMAILLLGEKPELFHLVGYALVLAGIFTASRRGSSRTRT